MKIHRILVIVIASLTWTHSLYSLGTEFENLDGWTQVIGKTEVVDGAAVLNVDPTKGLGELRTYMTLDIEQYPILEMFCSAGEYKVYLSDTSKSSESDYIRIGHKVGQGAARFYLKDLTPWRGRRNVVLVIQTQKSASIDYIRFIAQGEAEAIIHKIRPIPRYVVRKSVGAIKIDGQLNEAAWKRCEPTAPLRLTDGHLASLSTTTAKMMWDQDHLLVAIECVDKDIFAMRELRDDDLWEDDVVSLYLAIPNSPQQYLEFDINVRGGMTDLLNLRPSQGVLNWDCRGWECKVRMDGTTDDRSDEDVGWTIEMKIPLLAVYAQPLLPERAKKKEELWQGRSGKKLSDPLLAFDFRPRPGDVWRANIFRIDHEKDHVEYQAWSSPVIQRFHVIERFGELLFSADKVGKN